MGIIERFQVKEKYLFIGLIVQNILLYLFFKFVGGEQSLLSVGLSYFLILSSVILGYFYYSAFSKIVFRLIPNHWINSVVISIAFFLPIIIPALFLIDYFISKHNEENGKKRKLRHTLVLFFLFTPIVNAIFVSPLIFGMFNKKNELIYNPKLLHTFSPIGSHIINIAQNSMLVFDLKDNPGKFERNINLMYKIYSGPTALVLLTATDFSQIFKNKEVNKERYCSDVEAYYKKSFNLTFWKLYFPNIDLTTGLVPLLLYNAEMTSLVKYQKRAFEFLKTNCQND